PALWGELKVNNTAHLHRDSAESLPTTNTISFQTTTQRLNNTMSAFRSLKNPFVKSDALQTVIETLAQAGLWDLALDIAHTLAEEEQQTSALLSIVSATIAASRLDRAAEVARSIITSSQKAQALATVAAGLTAEQPSQAAALLSEAI